MKLMRKPQGIVIHHSATKDGKVNDWDAIQKYHTSYRCDGEIITKEQYELLSTHPAGRKLEEPWSDIAYHFGIESVDGSIMTVTGRGMQYEGAHCIGHNDMIGVCVVGDWDHEPPGADKMGPLTLLVAGLLRQHPYLSIKDVHKHSEYANKTCPGSMFPWDSFINRLRYLVQ